MALNLLHLALTLLIAAQGTNVTPALRAQAILVANNAISVAQADIATDSAPAPVFVENRTPPKLLVIPSEDGRGVGHCYNDPTHVCPWLVPKQ